MESLVTVLVLPPDIVREPSPILHLFLASRTYLRPGVLDLAPQRLSPTLLIVRDI
jgi:hypothetical protein